MTILCLNEERCRDLATLLHRGIINLKIIPVAFHNKLLDATKYRPKNLEQEIIKAQKTKPAYKLADEIKTILANGKKNR